VGWPGGRAERTCRSRDVFGLACLPGDVRMASADAAQLLGDRFSSPLLLRSKTACRLPDVLNRMAIAGGASYDAMVALAALEHKVDLATRDARARATYEKVGVVVILAG